MSVIHFQPARHLNGRLSWAGQLHRDLLDRHWLDRDWLNGHWERAFDFNRSGSFAEHNEELSDWSPAVDVRETDAAFVVHVDLPGIKSENLEITSDKGVLTIRGSRTAEAEEPNRYTRVERAYGKFARRFTLPETAKVDAIEAKFANGVLTVTIPKQEAVQPRRIEIASA